MLSPAVVRGGGVTVANGSGFPAATNLTLTLGNAAPVGVTTDAGGNVHLAVVVRSGERPGPTRLVAAAQPGLFDQVAAPLLVVLGTYQPQSATGPAFGSASILHRG